MWPGLRGRYINTGPCGEAGILVPVATIGSRGNVQLVSCWQVDESGSASTNKLTSPTPPLPPSSPGGPGRNKTPWPSHAPVAVL